MINKNFLLNYIPANRIFTSQEEIKQICENLDLNSKSKQELREIRNKVVEFYSPYIDKQYSENLEHDYMNAMQSVTAVIDKEIYSIICNEEGF